MKNKTWIDFGTINMAKDGKKFYIKLDKSVTLTVKGRTYKGEEFEALLNGGDTMNVEKVADKHAKISKGDKDREAEMNARVPEYIKYFISIPPEKK